MDKKELRAEAILNLKRLTKKRLYAAAEYIRWLERQDAEDETAELMAIPGFEERLKQAEEDKKAGRGVSWKELQERVRRDSAAGGQKGLPEVASATSGKA